MVPKPNWARLGKPAWSRLKSLSRRAKIGLGAATGLLLLWLCGLLLPTGNVEPGVTLTQAAFQQGESGPANSLAPAADEPSPTAEATETPEPSETPTEEPTDEPTQTPTAEPTQTPTEEPTSSHTPRPTATDPPPTDTPPPPTATLPPPTATLPPAATPTTAPPAGPCDPAYPTVCIPPPPPDLDCGQISHRRFQVLAPDPHNFDGDGNGIGCESD